MNKMRAKADLATEYVTALREKKRIAKEKKAIDARLETIIVKMVEHFGNDSDDGPSDFMSNKYQRLDKIE